MKKFKKPDRQGVRHRSRGLSAGGSPRKDVLSGREFPPGRCVVGIHAVRELLRVRGRAVDQVWLREHFQDHSELKELHDLAKRLSAPIHTKSVANLDRVISAHQGVIAFTREEPELNWLALKNSQRACLIVLDEVEDPHNVGAILRTAWLFGAQAVLVPELRAAHLSPAVSKVAQGAVEHIPLVRQQALTEQLKELKDMGFWILGMSHEAKQDLFSLDIPQKVVWVLGSESSGIRKSIAGVCDDFVRIPQKNPEASYNVSVAAAIAMAQTFQAHGA